MIILTGTQMFSLLSENMAIFEVNMATGKITWASKTLEEMFGYKIHGDLENKLIEVLIPPDKRDTHAAVHRPAFTSDPSVRMMGRRLPLEGWRADGQVFPVEVMLIPRAVDGIRVVVGVVFDMTERKSVKVPLSSHG